MRINTLTLNPAVDRTMYFNGIFTAGALNRSRESMDTVGGKGINVTRAATRLGMESTAYGFVGKGGGGRLFEELLSRENVSTDFVYTDADTRINIKMIDRDNTCTEANLPGGPIKKSEIDELFNKLSANNSPELTDWFVMGGSIPQGVENYVYNSIASCGKPIAKRIVMDCDGEALRQGIKARPYMIKPNLFELSQFVGRDVENAADAVECSREIFAQTGVRILCTMSEKGAVWYGGEDDIHTVESPKVEKIKIFVGAGDTFLTAFLSKFETEGSKTALEFAAKTAAAHVAGKD